MEQVGRVQKESVGDNGDFGRAGMVVDLPEFCLGGNFNKFVILNKSDMGKHLSYDRRNDIFESSIAIHEGRLREGKKDNTYLVINVDESYAPEIVEILKRNGHWG